MSLTQASAVDHLAVRSLAAVHAFEATAGCASCGGVGLCTRVDFTERKEHPLQFTRGDAAKLVKACLLANTPWLQVPAPRPCATVRGALSSVT